ncbi:MAG: hypothetical protein ABIO46_01965 [Chitinophagales bacterium]
MIATYRLNANELSEQLLETIRKSFPNKEIEIIVLEQDADEYLRSSPPMSSVLMNLFNASKKEKTW